MSRKTSWGGLIDKYNNITDLIQKNLHNEMDTAVFTYILTAFHIMANDISPK